MCLALRCQRGMRTWPTVPRLFTDGVTLRSFCPNQVQTITHSRRVNLAPAKVRTFPHMYACFSVSCIRAHLGCLKGLWILEDLLWRVSTAFPFFKVWWPRCDRYNYFLLTKHLINWSLIGQYLSQHEGRSCFRTWNSLELVFTLGGKHPFHFLRDISLINEPSYSDFFILLK